MIWARTDTSSAETGSSSTMSRVSVASARAMAIALALAAAELVREQRGDVGREADEVQHRVDALGDRRARQVGVDLQRLGDDVAQRACAG